MGFELGSKCQMCFGIQAGCDRISVLVIVCKPVSMFLRVGTFALLAFKAPEFHIIILCK